MPRNDDFRFDSDENDIFSASEEKSLDLNAFSSVSTAAEAKKKKRRKTGKQRFLKLLLTTFLIGVITCSLVIGSFIVYVFTMVDDTMEENLNDLKLNFTTTIYIPDGNGGYSEYQRLHGEFNRIWVNYDRNSVDNPEYTGISQNLVDAFVAVEDKRFFLHQGVDWKRTFSAFANLFFHFYSSNQGGSTITQQLVKNLTGDSSQKPSRKIREIMRARYLEKHYSKDVIVECYLNTIAMGHGTYGVEVAANYYFGKSVHDLTLAECAALAAIARSPRDYAPDDYPEENKERRITVLSLMLEQGYITQEEYDAAAAEELNIVAKNEGTNESEINSYFVDALISQVVADLAEKYGYDSTHASTMFYSGGYKIYATVDTAIQSQLEAVFYDAETYGIKGADGQQLQGSMTVLDYQGNVKGLVGGIGQKTENRGFNRATSAVRQPGSTMKPIAAYAPALENDLIHYSAMVNDTATNYNGWKPVNWYKSYWGNISVAYALERSVNTIPVYLVNRMTPQVSFDFLTQTLGITTLTEEDINLSPLGMGGTNGGLTTLESAAAYAVFGNGGLYYKPRLYTSVCDQRDNVILSAESEPVMAISEDTATIMNHLLRNVVYGSNGTGAGARSFIPNMKIYAKTGTSNDSKDLWFVGGSPYYVASCWCGYDTQQDIPNSQIAMRMWGAVMSKLHSGLTAKEFTDSDYAVERYYCTQTGLLATDSCPSKAAGWYKRNSLPANCSTHSGTALKEPSEDDSDSNDASSTASSSSEENSDTGEE